MTLRVICFGEVMLRLRPPGFERFLQSPAFEATFGGAEANVAVSLANYGMDAAFVTVFPANDIAAACISQLRGFGVDTSHIKTVPGRLGVYYVETGSNQRSGKIIYDRENSTIAQAKPGDLDWKQVFSGAGWLYITGITPAISKAAADLSLEAVKAAHSQGLQVACDFNYRANLWKWGKTAAEVMTEIAPYIDLGIANAEACEMCLGITPSVSLRRGEWVMAEYEKLARKVAAAFPGMRTLAFTLRKGHSADDNTVSACLFSEGRFYTGPKYKIGHVVDRIGSGDAFAAGLIYGLAHYEDKGDALAFATASGCLKHTVPGDFSRINLTEVERLMHGEASGKIQR
jgi:2-dehydro-3-deoxygluconokinase